jgi:2-polyprenyl-6-methoxyphenol hydroxylase-like FAD-dependent oxidoreductase
MIGDAAMCGTPISGQGTSLSLCGAYILAAELATSPNDHRVAFKRYEALMRPNADKAQSLPSFVPGIMHPETWWGVAIMRGLARVVGVVWNLPYPQFVVHFINRQDLGADKLKVPEYTELLGPRRSRS